MFVTFKLASHQGSPIVLVILIVLVLAYSFLTQRTVVGRQIYAVGGNADAARLSGINTRKVIFWVYVNMGILGSLAGIVLAARNASGSPSAGTGFELDAIAACFIGGTSTRGGIGTIGGIVIGALIMGVLNNGMSLMGIDSNWQQVVKGVVLLGAVSFDLYNKSRKPN
jgi:putative multiple sugar transport system permease protein